MNTDKISFEMVEGFKYLEKNLNKSKLYSGRNWEQLKPGNLRYHSVQNLLSSSLLSKNLKIEVYRTIILPVVLCGCEILEKETTWGTQV